MIVANPVAGTTSEELIRDVVALTSSACSQVVLHRTSCRGDATSAVRRALAEPDPPGLVVVVGGDGTVAEVVSALAGTTVTRLAAVPAGTGNSGFKMLWGETPWSDALAAVLDGERADSDDIDLARLRETGELVYLGASAGLVAQTLVTARSSTARGRPRYASALVETAATFTPYPGRVTVDGRVLHEGDTVVANVGGGPYRGGQYLLLPHSVLDDGLLDVCVIGSPVPPADVPEAMRHGDHLALDGVVYGRGRQVTVERLDGHPLCFECDGELHDDVAPSMTLDVLPHALPVWRRSAAPLRR